MTTKNWILLLLSFLFGIAGMIPDMNSSLRTALLFVAGIMILIVVILNLKESINFQSAWSILRTAKKLGLHSLHSTGSSGKMMNENLMKADSIKILTTAGPVFFRTKEEELTKALSQNCHIQIILSESGTEYANEIERIEERASGEVDNELIQVLTTLKRCESEAKKLNANSNGSVNIRRFKTLLRLPVIICDDKYVWLTLTLPPKRSSQSMSIEFINSGKTPYASTCIKHFDELWAFIGSEYSNPANSNLLTEPATLFKSDTWKLEYSFEGSNGFEYFSVKNNEYWVNGIHHFNLDQFSVDSYSGELTFRKVPVDPKRKKVVNVLKYVSADKLEGLEDGHVKVTYYRM